MRLLLLLFVSCAFVARAHDVVTANPKLLQDSVPVLRLAGDEGKGITFKIEVPPNAENFVVKTTGGTGDSDLFLRYNAHPTETQYDFSSEGPSTNELIRIGTPVEGTWYVRIMGLTAYRNVRLTASYLLPRGAVRMSHLLPGPGTFSERLTVRLSRPRGTVVRYTTDGTTPDQNSPIYTRPLALTADTQVRAKTFNRAGASSLETVGDYKVQPKGIAEPLTVGKAEHFLAAVPGTGHLFKLTVPPDADRLLLTMEGGTGDAQMYVKAGVAASPTMFDQRATRRGNNALVSIQNPVVGDWYVSLPARLGYKGVSLLATVRVKGVDLIAWAPSLDPYVSTETYTADDCEVREGMTTVGTHRFLRFSTQTRNIGVDDMHLGVPEGNSLFQYFECHGHYHFNGFASYQLLNSNNQPVALGRKMSFCLEDIIRWDPKAPLRNKYFCDDQGIQSGWADIYDAGLPGQWIDITGVAPGTYRLVITMNPDHLIPETDYSNNTASTQIVIE